MRTIWTIVFGTGVLIGMLLTYLVQAVVGAAARPDPSLQVKDWLTVMLAGVALVVSFGALAFNYRKARQETFLNIHDKLIAVDLQEGRRLLYNEINAPEDPARLLREDPVNYAKVNRALVMFDVLGLYVKRGYISKTWVLDEWGPTLAKARKHANHFIAHRTAIGAPLWPNFGAISLEAKIRSQKGRDSTGL